MNNCTHCGASLDGAINFCKNCGAKLDKGKSLALSEKTPEAGIADRKKLAIIIGAGAAVLALALVLVFTVFLNKPETDRPLTVAELLDLGEKYLLDLDYEQALVQYLAVIEIEPRNERGYTGAAEAYIGLGEIDNARNILWQGLRELPDNTTIATRMSETATAAEAQMPTPTPTPTPSPMPTTDLYADLIAAFKRYEDSGWTDYNSIPAADSDLMFPDSDRYAYAQNWTDIIFQEYIWRERDRPNVSLQYGFFDINSNGTEELFIGALYENGAWSMWTSYASPSILAIYTISDGAVLPVICRAWAYEDILVFDDHTLEHGSWGVNSYSYGRYSIMADYSRRLEYREDYFGGFYGTGAQYSDKNDNPMTDAEAQNVMSAFSNTHVPLEWHPLDHFFSS